MQLKRVLIITYYWVPLGGSGVQRWVKFSKYLPELGWQPVVYTPSNPDFPLKDDSLIKDIPAVCEVITQPIWEPYRLASIFSKNKNLNTGMLRSNKDGTWKDQLMNYVRSNYFIPDPRVFWVKKSIKYLTHYLQKNPVDAIVTNGPPHSMHLIGLGLKKKLGLKWLADFRDPWTSIDFYHTLALTKRSDAKHRRLEREVVSSADIVTVVSSYVKKEYDAYSDAVKVITNGFDSPNQKVEIPLDEKFSIAHIGLMNVDRNPQVLWKAIKKIGDEHPDFKKDVEIKIIGNISEEGVNAIKENGLMDNLNLVGYLPHAEVYPHQQAAQILLLAINNTPTAEGIIPGKIFEYLMSKRPILAIGPPSGALADILNQTSGGSTFDFEDLEGLENYLLDAYAKYKKGKWQVNSKNIEQYSRRNLTKKLVNHLEQMTKK
ncbi:MAG: glycosyltransferase [Bacteroidota bacterium]